MQNKFIQLNKSQQSSNKQILKTNPSKKAVSSTNGIPRVTKVHPSTTTTGPSSKVLNSKTLKVMSSGQKPVATSLDVVSRLSEVFDTGVSVAKTVTGLASGDPTSLLSVPNTLVKVIDTAKNVIRDINSSDTATKPVVVPKSNLDTPKGEVLLDSLKRVQPVVTVTQLPSSNGIEVDLPQLRSSGPWIDKQGFQCETINVSIASTPIASPGTGGGWAQNSRIVPRDINKFGDRVANHYAKIYQQFRIKRGTMQWLPRVGYDAKGTMAFNFMLGIDVASVELPNAIPEISQRSKREIKTINCPFSLSIDGDMEWRFTGLPVTGTPDSLRSFCEFVSGVYVENCEPLTGDLGRVVYVWEIEFRSSTTTPWSFFDKIAMEIADGYSIHSPVSDYRSYLKGIWYLFKIITRKKIEEDNMDELGINLEFLLSEFKFDREFELYVRNFLKRPSNGAFLPLESSFYSLLSLYDDHLNDTDVHKYEHYNYAEDIEGLGLAVGSLKGSAAYVFSRVFNFALETVLVSQLSLDDRKMNISDLALSALQLTVRIVLSNVERIYLKNYFGDYIVMGRDKMKQIEIRSGYMTDSFKMFLNMNQREILNCCKLALDKKLETRSLTSRIDDQFDIINSYAL